MAATADNSAFRELFQQVNGPGQRLKALASTLNDTVDAVDSREQYERIDGQVLKIASLLQRMEDMEEAYSKAMTQAAGHEDDEGTVDAAKIYKKEYNNRRERLPQNTKRHPVVKEFKRRAQERGNQNVNAADDGDEDLAVVDAQVSIKCPISQSVLKSPMRGECGHVFSRASIEEIRKSQSRRSKKSAFKCPVCHKAIREFTRDRQMDRIVAQTLQAQEDSRLTQLANAEAL
eukprot:Clim_evm17s143 gene=Clim_evmTU17s143